MIAAGNSLALNRGIQEEQAVPARYPARIFDYRMGRGSSSKHFSFPIFFHWSFPIPFIEHNDANRALMSSNMQRVKQFHFLGPKSALLELDWNAKCFRFGGSRYSRTRGKNPLY
ncbi:hypothetical protein HID58_094730 [Brassica napus]|uniref:Uncharacterized protein n=1 Tax=Brassica napus TaxID=3708 RepID=A0ABQ7X6B1_BRANA|nr:hypothetical protein HID58_094730 [Brassica napus]